MRKIIFVLLLMLFPAASAMAALNVVATLPWIGSLAKDIGGDKVNVATLVKPNRDPHMVEAKPSMILAGRKADILMYNGLDLEIGYLPLILESARNPKIVPGKPGNFDCSRLSRLSKNRRQWIAAWGMSTPWETRITTSLRPIFCAWHPG